MDTRKDKSNSAPIIANRRATSRNDDAMLQNQVQVVQTKLATSGELSIAAETDFGGDPYNNTGQHMVLKAKQAQGE